MSDSLPPADARTYDEFMSMNPPPSNRVGGSWLKPKGSEDEDRISESVFYSEEAKDRLQQVDEIRDRVRERQRKLDSVDKRTQREAGIVNLDKYRPRKAANAFNDFLARISSTVEAFPSFGVRLAKLPILGKIASASLKEVDDARVQAKKDSLLIKRQNTEIEALQQQLREKPTPPPEQALTIDREADKITKQKARLLEYAAVSNIGEDDWPLEEFDEILSNILRLRGAFKEVRVHEWLSLEMTKATSTDRSAREQAVWLFTSIVRGSEWSLADIHALVVGLSNAQLDTLEMVVAFTAQAAHVKTDKLLQQASSIRIGTALAIARLYELLAMQLGASTAPLQRSVEQDWIVFKPLFAELIDSSLLLKVLSARVDGLFDNDSLSLTDSFTVLSWYRVGDLNLVDDSLNLVLMDGDKIRYLRFGQYELQLTATGWRFKLSAFPCDGPETYTEYLVPDTCARATASFSRIVKAQNSRRRLPSGPHTPQVPDLDVTVRE